MKIAGIDVHKKVLVVVVVHDSVPEEKPARRRLSRCRASCSDSENLVTGAGVEEAKLSNPHLWRIDCQVYVVALASMNLQLFAFLFHCNINGPVSSIGSKVGRLVRNQVAVLNLVMKLVQ